MLLCQPRNKATILPIIGKDDFPCFLPNDPEICWWLDSTSGSKQTACCKCVRVILIPWCHHTVSPIENSRSKLELKTQTASCRGRYRLRMLTVRYNYISWNWYVCYTLFGCVRLWGLIFLHFDFCWLMKSKASVDLLNWKSSRFWVPWFGTSCFFQ